MSGPRHSLAQTVEEFIKITTSISTERDLNRLLNTIVTSARILTGSEGGRIYILDNIKRNLYLEVCQNEHVGGEQEEQQHALKSLIHLVGDIHQPLHVGNGTDKGGNDIKLKYFWKSSNLHRVWRSLRGLLN